MTSSTNDLLTDRPAEWQQSSRLDRRQMLLAGSSAMLASTFGASGPMAAPHDVLSRPIPSSGEPMPIVGLGSWITFNIGNDPKLLARSTNVIRAFFEAGGRMIDSSPMYGSSQATIGHALKQLEYPQALFSAEKVWTSSRGAAQIEQTRNFWGVPQFDLIQVHNLVAWEQQLRLLTEMKSSGKLRYVGLTTSHGLRHRQLERLMSQEKIDFVQLTYNAVDRDAEKRLLPLAQERGIAIIANRPFRQGHLVRQAERHPLPDWAADVGATSWAQLLLKYVVSHPAVTCAIPATTRVDHVRENVASATGVMPDAKMRQRIAKHIASL